MLCALILSGQVSDVRELTEEQYQANIQYYEAIIDITDLNPQPVIGWVLVGNTLQPPEGQSATPVKKITKLALRNRFTLNEKVTLETAAESSALLRSWISDFNVSTYVDLNRPDTQAGIQYLETAGLISAGRANEILNTPITEIEKYKGQG